MISLRALIRLQATFAAASLAYLLLSLIRRETTGDALSAVPIGPSIALFLVYLAILYLPRTGRLGWYRLGMIPALILFGGGGVVGNILNYMETGLEHYASFPAFVVAVAINAFGTTLNAIALLGMFRTEPED